jgi:hypothetical protein
LSRAFAGFLGAAYNVGIRRYCDIINGIATLTTAAYAEIHADLAADKYGRFSPPQSSAIANENHSHWYAL